MKLLKTIGYFLFNPAIGAVFGFFGGFFMGAIVLLIRMTFEGYPVYFSDSFFELWSLSVTIFLCLGAVLGLTYSISSIISKKRNKFKDAREFMRKSFDKDEDFEHGYISNIACLLHDENTRHLSWKECNVLAKKLMNLIFR